MLLGLLLCFAGQLLAQQYRPPLPERTSTTAQVPNRNDIRLLSPARQRLQARKILQEQIKRWRAQSSQTLPHLAQQTLEEEPQLSGFNISSAELEDRFPEMAALVRSNVQEVVLQFVREMRIPADPWEKAYVGRLLVALLKLAHDDQLASQDRLLVQILVSGPRFVRELPRPNIKFPQSDQNSVEPSEVAENGQRTNGNSEAYLLELRQAREDAEKRNAQDERIMWTNQAIEIFYRDLTAVILNCRTPSAYNAVIKRISGQLATRDAAFQQTVEVLERFELTGMSLADLRLMRARLNRLAKQFGGKRQYIVYTEVRKQVRTQSNFARRELDFSHTIAKLLARLAQRIEGPGRTESPEALEVTPGPTMSEPVEEPERTPALEY